MAAPKKKTKADLEREAREAMIARIRLSIEARRGKSMFDDTPSRMHGPMCRCGIPRKAPGISMYVNDDGRCTVHPDRPPVIWVRGVNDGG